MLLNRLLKSKIPISNHNLKTDIFPNKIIDSKIENNQINQKRYYDKSAKRLPGVEKNDKVIKKNNRWERGVVADKYNERSYAIKDVQGNQYRRNRKLVHKTKVQKL